jgi:hypothetical protein
MSAAAPLEFWRAAYGGLFTALGLCALVSQSPVVFTVVGLGWAGLAALLLVPHWLG